MIVCQQLEVVNRELLIVVYMFVMEQKNFQGYSMIVIWFNFANKIRHGYVHIWYNKHGKKITALLIAMTILVYRKFYGWQRAKILSQYFTIHSFYVCFFGSRWGLVFCLWDNYVYWTDNFAYVYMYVNK